MGCQSNRGIAEGEGGKVEWNVGLCLLRYRYLSGGNLIMV